MSFVLLAFVFYAVCVMLGPMITQQIRRDFLNYFKKRHHAVIPSSPVVPHDDPTLLFTNAGMNQFKDVFLGKSHRDYTRAATSQKCVRVGGKHNDLENVGHTRRHMTFFEMLGNFSFGDYFKKEAIQFAWEISTEVFGFDPDRIWPTVFREDDEAFALWEHYVPSNRITRFDEKDNFWTMGDTGPCGPCSELLYDRGDHYGTGKRPLEDPSGERFLEFWNLVFMQYNRQANGNVEPLPRPSIDTGAGLERVVSIKMDVDSVFETDILRGLIAEMENISGIAYHHGKQQRDAAFRVVADHLRCLSFAIADGVQPSNVDRGYVLRKLLRRAVRYGRTLGFEEPFLARLLPRLVSLMGDDYRELVVAQNRISEILTIEEEAFIRTLRRGGNLLSTIMEKARAKSVISGDDAFKLKDTYGFPIEEIVLLAKDAGLKVDESRYQVLEQEAKERSRSTHKSTQQIAGESIFIPYIEANGPCEFVGYTSNKSLSKITALIVDGKFVPKITTGQKGIVVLDRTPFYAEMGGQIGDSGRLYFDGVLFEVENCDSPYKGVIAHSGTLKSGELTLNKELTAEIDSERRQKIANNHTATHLLHWALHTVLGGHVKQAGSIVEPTRIRFDFSHHKPLTQDEIYQIEDLVNREIRANTPVKGYELPYEEVQKRDDIKQFFGEKYGSVVRVIDIDHSKELCGGTHTHSVGTIGLFRIAKESSIAAGVRRIEAVTGTEAELMGRHQKQLIDRMATVLKTQPEKLFERLEKFIEEYKELQNNLKAARKGILNELIASLVGQIEKINGINLIAAEVAVSNEELTIIADELINRLVSGVVVLAAKNEDKCQLRIRVSDDLVTKGIKAVDLIKVLAPIVEGGGGGKPNGAEAGGKAPHKIPEALSKAKDLL